MLHTSATVQVPVLSYNLTALPLITEPSLYAGIDVHIVNTYFCARRREFKSNLASRLILLDGVSRASPGQIVIFKHACNDITLRNDMAKDVQFYVSKANTIGESDYFLTMLAYRLVEQMIYDGSTWKLGLDFYKYLSEIRLLGSDRPDLGLSDLQITYIGVGSLAVLILIIIIIVYIISCCRDHCCRKSYDTAQPQKEYVEISMVLHKDEKGYTNQLFEQEKKHVEGAAANGNEKGRSFSTFQSDYPDGNMEAIDGEVNAGINDAENMSFSSSSSFDNEQIDDDKDLNVDELALATQDLNALTDEFNSISKIIPASFLYPAEAAVKNRVDGKFPWPESRVVLSTSDSYEDPSEDYINASYVKDDTGKAAYIITQGPLESTTDDFWKMVWEQDVSIIVMATPLVLIGEEMCHQYWPVDQIPREYGGYIVQLTKKELKPDFLVTTVTVSDKVKSRQIYLFRFMAWPQGDAPINSRTVVAFLLEIRDVSETMPSIITLHCSSGTGMSAVFIAILKGMILLEKHHVVNVKKVVRLLRREVAGAVDTVEQYQLIYEALHQYALFVTSSS